MGTYSSRTGNCKSVGQVLGHVVSFKHQGEQARPGEQATPQELARPEPPELFLMPLRNMEQLSAAEAQLKNFTNRTLPVFMCPLFHNIDGYKAAILTLWFNLGYLKIYANGVGMWTEAFYRNISNGCPPKLCFKHGRWQIKNE